MLTKEYLADNTENTDEISKSLTAADIGLLVSMLDEKEDEVRYVAFKTLISRSRLFDDVSPYWDRFCNKISSENSYQRNIGIRLISENVRWDRDGKFDRIAGDCLSHCQDEKFITSRLAIQSILNWVDLRPGLHAMVIDRLCGIDLFLFKDTQKKLILLDILSVLSAIQRSSPSEKIICYISDALSGGLLDKKSKREFEKLLK